MDSNVSINVSSHTATNQLNVHLKLHHALGMTINHETLTSGAMGDAKNAAKVVAHGMVKDLENAVYDKVLSHLQTIENMPSIQTSEVSLTFSSVLEDEFKTWSPYADNNYTATATNDYEDHSTVKQLKEVFGALDETAVCPGEDCYLPKVAIKLSALIPHLNDGTHEWSREQIADWLETLDIDIKAKEDNNAD